MLKRIWGLGDLLAPARARLSRPPEVDLSVAVSRDEAAAEWRWHYSNEENRRRGCPCGRPAQVAKAHHAVVGTVPFLWWTCEDHAGATGFSSSTIGGVTATDAMFEHTEPCPLGAGRGSRGPIGGPPTHFHCPHRTHEETR